VSAKHDPEKWRPVFRKDHAQTTLRVRIGSQHTDAGLGH
jgi:hypothetical protein